jgi:hypothetical protein
MTYLAIGTRSVRAAAAAAARPTFPPGPVSSVKPAWPRHCRTPATARLISALVAARAEDPELRELAAQFWAVRFSGVRQVLERAGMTADVGAVVEALVAPLYFRAMITGGPIDDALVDQCARAAAAATMPPSGARSV